MKFVTKAIVTFLLLTSTSAFALTEKELRECDPMKQHPQWIETERAMNQAPTLYTIVKEAHKVIIAQSTSCDQLSESLINYNKIVEIQTKAFYNSMRKIT